MVGGRHSVNTVVRVGCKCLIHDGRKDDREPILQMSLNLLFEVLHPIESTLEFYLHITDAFGVITDAFGVHLRHSQDTLFISCPSLLVL